MNLLYVLSADDLKIKDIVQYETYQFTTDIDFTEKSTVDVAKNIDVSEGDFIVCKCGSDVVYQGICDTIESANEGNATKINLKQIEQLFDQKIVVGNVNTISQTGIEDFIKNEIESNFVTSDDTFLNRSYITVTCSTHNTINAKPEVENDIYNLKTYIGNAKQYYGIFLDFTFTQNTLLINISKKSQSALYIDTSVTDITDIDEVYEIDALTKLTVIWKIPDGVQTTRKYYLLNDRTITTNSTHQNRAKGKSDTVYIEAETEEEMYQEVINNFSGNSYNHSVEYDVLSSSYVYPKNELYVGHTCKIKTTKHGTKDSIITKVTIENSTNSIHLKFGNLKITLIEKLRGR